MLASAGPIQELGLVIVPIRTPFAGAALPIACQVAAGPGCPVVRATQVLGAGQASQVLKYQWVIERLIEVDD